MKKTFEKGPAGPEGESPESQRLAKSPKVQAALRRLSEHLQAGLKNANVGQLLTSTYINGVLSTARITAMENMLLNPPIEGQNRVKVLELHIVNELDFICEQLKEQAAEDAKLVQPATAVPPDVRRQHMKVVPTPPKP